MSKPTYALSSELYPELGLIEALAAGTGTSFEQQVRAHARAGYTNQSSVDKELQRFMKPALMWGAFMVDHTPKSFHQPLGKHSWLASVDKAPFVPQEAQRVLHLFKEPRSVLHLVGATVCTIRIMYIAENLDHASLQNIAHLPSSDLLLLVVKPEVCASFTDELISDRLSARSVIGFVGKGASVTIVGETSLNQEASCLVHDRWYLEKGAQLTVHELFTGGSQSWLRKEFILGQDAQVEYTWRSALTGHEQVAVTTVQEHEGSSSTSAVDVKAALSGQARSFYRGMIRIGEHASQADADQQHKALVMSPDVMTCAIPALEVATHEVQCAHGSAVGQFNDEEVQFLQTRGLTSERIRELLLTGFFSHEYVNEQKMKRLHERISLFNNSHSTRGK